MLGALIGLLLALAISLAREHIGGEFRGLYLASLAFIVLPLIGGLIGEVIQQLKK